MKIFLVKTSVGEWEDTVELTDSAWTEEKDALARIKILEDKNRLEERNKTFCWNCPLQQFEIKDPQELLKQAKNYCQTYCFGKGKPYYDDQIKSVECNECSANYDSVTVYSPEAVNLDNPELLKK